MTAPLLWRAPFRRYLVLRFAAATGTTMLRAAIAWQVFAITHSAFHLGLVGIVQFTPALVFSLVGGATADTVERRRVMTFGQLVPLACAALLAGSTALGGIHLGLLYGTVFVIAVSNAFDGPAQAALLPSIVPRDEFPRAVAAAQTNRSLAFATGPAVCGVLIGEIGVGAAHAVAASLFVVSLTAVLGFEPGGRSRGDRRVDWTAIREGLAFVRRQPIVLACMTLDLFAVIFGGVTALLPIYATDILHVGAHGYGILAAALDVGAILCAAALTWLPPITRAGPALIASITAYGVAIVVFGLSRWFPLSVAAYVAVGIADEVSVVLRSTTIQLTTPDELRGRVSSINLLFINASNQLGAAESGFVAALTSATFSAVSGGVMSLVAVAIVAWAFPELRRYRLQLRDVGR